jgi:hypothetical protein
MNREIKYRGRDVIAGNWAYGFYYQSKGHHIIRDSNDRECIVLGKTVGEFTGLKDKNDKDIYEGDVITQIDETVQVYFNTATACFDALYLGGDSDSLVMANGWISEDVEVIGNIYQDKNLI